MSNFHIHIGYVKFGSSGRAGLFAEPKQKKSDSGVNDHNVKYIGCPASCDAWKMSAGLEAGPTKFRP